MSRNTETHPHSTQTLLLRSLALLCGLFFNGLGMTVMRMSCLGTEPFSCLNYSISGHFGISMGLSAALVNGAILLVDLFAMRRLLGVGTVATIFCLGTAADAWQKILTAVLGRTITFTGWEQLPLRLALLACGMLTMILCCALIMSCNLGMAPYDTLGYVVERYTHKIPFHWARVGFDCACVLCAYLLAQGDGSQWQLIGLGTVLMAFCIGPLLAFFRRKLTDLLMEYIAQR